MFDKLKNMSSSIGRLGSITIPIHSASALISEIHYHAERIQIEFEANIFKAFEQYGYNKEWLTNVYNTCRVRIKYIPNFIDDTASMIKIFSIDDEDLFGVVEISTCDFENFNCSVEQQIFFIKEIQHGGEIDEN